MTIPFGKPSTQSYTPSTLGEALDEAPQTAGDMEEGVLPEEFLTCDVHVHGQAYHVTILDKMLLDEVGGVGSFSLQQIDSLLNRLPLHMASWIHLAEHVRHEREQKELEFKAWLGQIREDVQRALLHRRLELYGQNKDNGASKQWFGTFTGDEIQGYIIGSATFRQVYKAFTEDISQMKQQETMLRAFAKAAEGKQYSLSALAERLWSQQLAELRKETR